MVGYEGGEAWNQSVKRQNEMNFHSFETRSKSLRLLIIHKPKAHGLG